jgi:lipoprotein-releasing system permease protein
VPWYLYLALKQLFSSGQRLFFTLVSAVSVALGVGLLIVVMSVMGGFGYEIREKIVDTQGDITVRASGFIADSAAVESVIRKVPGVVATSAFAEGVVMLESEDRPAPVFPTIHGFDMDTVGKVIPLGRYITGGSLDELDDDSIILSSILASQIGAGPGSKVEVYTPLALEKARNDDEILLPSALTVTGIFEIGHQQLDSSTVIVTLRKMQDLYGLGRAVHGINVKIAQGLDVDDEAGRINEALRRAQGTELPQIPGLEAKSWAEINQDFLWVLQLEKNIMTLILLFVVIVAAFLTMSLLLVLVLKKTREIGLLGALGAGRRAIAFCFCLQGVCIGVVGTAGGLVLGFTFLHFRNDLVRLVTRFTGSQAILERFYQFSELPAHTSGRDLVIVIASAIVLSTLAGVIPAAIAGSMKPAEALRNE